MFHRLSPRFPLLVFFGFALLLALAGCGGKGKDTVYPPPDTLSLAPVQRQEFVDAFLQGHWCQAKALFDQSMENYLRQDEFCRASYNHYLMYKLKGYIEIDAPEELFEARRLASLSAACNSIPSQGPAPARRTAKDAKYTRLLEHNKFNTLLKLLAKDVDPLYASVYARKVAVLAHAQGAQSVRNKALQLARSIDARQGWIVFLVEDWKLTGRFSTKQKTRRRIAGRIEILEDLIRPCGR
jgi:predicted small lipoprotein YifL